MPRPPASPSPATRIRWIILAFVLLASFISYFVRTNLSVLGDEMIDDLGLTPLQLGYVFSAFAAGIASADAY
jgi:ACS family glucarate transporter-like MFS transporter